jgi:hypothetical protein
MIDRSYYVETSVWGMVPKGQPPDMRRATIRFLRQMPRRQCFVSRVVLNEINVCSPSIRKVIHRYYAAVQPRLLELTEPIKELASFYISTGILPAKKTDDALHVAFATVEELDVLVSWNHRHMVNARKTDQYRGANLAKGYWKTPHILTPLEVLNE